MPRITIPLPYWMMPEWWQYVLDNSRATKSYWAIQIPEIIPDEVCEKLGFSDYEISFRSPLDWLKGVWCRATGHRGIEFFNPGGLEPNTNCRGCGENLG